jgi:hypothetical protein
LGLVREGHPSDDFWFACLGGIVERHGGARGTGTTGARVVVHLVCLFPKIYPYRQLSRPPNPRVPLKNERMWWRKDDDKEEVEGGGRFKKVGNWKWDGGSTQPRVWNSGVNELKA